MEHTSGSGRAIVTGASSGIGKAVAEQLATDGWVVLAVARREGRLAELAQRHPGRIVPFVADITADGAPAAVVAEAQKRLCGLDLLINNAGTSWVGPFAQMPAERLDQILDLNVRALMLMCREAIPLLERSDRAQIINVSSVVGQIPMETIAAYCASKAAVTMFSRVLALELKSKKIRVNALSPCGTDSEIFEKAGSTGVDPAALVSAEDMARMVLLLTRLPEGLDIAHLSTHKRFEPL